MAKPTQLIRERTGELLTLATSPFPPGGEGKIYTVAGSELLAKVYHEPSPERGEKLLAMLQYPPRNQGSGAAHFSIAWPVDRLLEPGSGRCVGFLMRRMEKKEPLVNLYNPKARRRPASRHLLMETTKNLAGAVHSLHEGGYVIGDLNESNILVGEDASVSLVDADSFQVKSSGRVYRSPVGRPEFTPPELQGVSCRDTDRKPEHDHFGLAVLIFLLLMKGNHPFSAEYTGKGDRPPLQKRIAKGLWPYGSKANSPFRPRKEAPPLHTLPRSLQTLMRQCFEEGHEDPGRRPTAAMWEAALEAAEASWFKRLLECLLRRSELVGEGALRKLRSISRSPYRWVWVTVLVLILLLVGFLFPRLRPGQGEDKDSERSVSGKATPRLWNQVQGK